MKMKKMFKPKLIRNCMFKIYYSTCDKMYRVSHFNWHHRKTPYGKCQIDSSVKNVLKNNFIKMVIDRPTDSHEKMKK